MSTTLAAPAPIAVPEPAASTRTQRLSRLALTIVVSACCLVAACYSVVVPPFEAPDEPGHYEYVQWIASGNGIPLQGQEPPPLQPEFSQPPLYYLVQAPIAWVAGSQPANLPMWEGHHNPFQNRTSYGNVNLYLHSAAEAFPWSGDVLGVHLMRLTNALFVALIVLASYGCAIELGLPTLTALLASATLGLIPQVLFLGGALNADNAIGSLSVASLYLLLRWLNRGPNLRLAVLLGLAAGGAALAKLSGLITVGLVLGFMGVGALRAQGKGHRAKGKVEEGARGAQFKIQNSKFKSPTTRDLLVTAALAAAVAGWWYFRNWLAFGDPLGWNAMLLSTGDMLRRPPLSFGAAFATLLRHASSGLAVFGWTNLSVHPAVYWVCGVLVLLGVVGLLAAMRRRALRAPTLALWLLVVWPVAFIVSLARWVEVNTAADQWRLLFPAYPALILLVVTGWRGLVLPPLLYDQGDPLRFARGQASLNAQNDKRAWVPFMVIPAGLLTLNVGALAFVIAPAYAGPQTGSGPIEHAANVQFGDSLQLVGYSAPQPLASRPGDTVEIDLFWRLSAPIAKDYATDIGIIDAQTTLTSKELSIPDEGRAPMSAWQADQVVRDRHRIRTGPEMVGAQTLILSVIDPEPPGIHLPASNGGVRLQNDAVTLTRFMVLPPSQPQPETADNAALQDHLKLTGHSLAQANDRLQATLVWTAEGGTPSKDYTVFVHMLTPDGKQVAQHDGQPGGGEFPTSLLPSGASISDTHLLDIGGLPAGDYKLEVGLYELSSGARLPTVSGDSSVIVPVTLR